MTVIHEAEELSASSANEHGPETKGTRVKIPGVNIPDFAESIISVEVLAERFKQSSLGGEGQAIKSWRRGSSNQFLAERAKQSSLGREGRVIKSYLGGLRNEDLTRESSTTSESYNFTEASRYET